MASFIVYGDASGQVTVAAPSVAGTNTITFPAETGTLITSAYTGTALPGQIAWNTTVQTTGFTAVAYGGYFCNTTSAAFTVTLPASPARGDFVVIVDYAGTAATNNITVAGNGAKINGSGNKLLQTNRQGITFTYIDSTQGWLATSNVYGGNPPFITAPYTASYLVVAGGGSGGCYAYGGGGGAGGYLSGTITINSGTVYTATVGAGGAGAATRYVANSGSNSVLSGSGITTQTAIGGGYGAQLASGNASGGSGGGGTYVNAGTSPGAAGTPGQGNAGGTTTGRSGGSGGGGASAAGTGASTTSGTAGGAGTASSITGTPATYAGGGGGGGIDPSGGSGPGGAGGGGNGGSGSSVNGVDGTANTGGGGGGSSFTPAFTAASGSGGSGVVILSVPTASYSGTVTGSPTVTTSGSNTIITWTTAGSGTYTG